MPSKNALKIYESGGFYHIYNRGVNKRLIFKTSKDYSTFLAYLKFYLTSPLNRPDTSKSLKNFSKDIMLIAYCLMPNHFHLVLKQNSNYDIAHFMSSLSTKYVRYFNSRYNRIGPLFQGRYKAVHITNEYQFTYLSKYIHRNPLSLNTYKNNPSLLMNYKYSSYGNYLRLFTQAWINPEDILVYFSKTNPHNTYQNFVEESEPDDINIIKELTLDME